MLQLFALQFAYLGPDVAGERGRVLRVHDAGRVDRADVDLGRERLESGTQFAETSAQNSTTKTSMYIDDVGLPFCARAV